MEQAIATDKDKRSGRGLTAPGSALETPVMAGTGRERTKRAFRHLPAEAGLSPSGVVPLPAGTSRVEAFPN